MATAGLQSSVRRTSERLLAVQGTTALCWAALTALLVVLAAVWLDLLWEFSSAGRVAALFLGALAAMALIVVLLRRLMHDTTRAAVARRLDAAAGGRGEILSGWELATGQCATAHGDAAPLTLGLAQLAVDQATQSARLVAPAKAVPWRPLKIAALSLVGLTLVVALLALCMPSLARTQFRRFANPFGDTPPFSHIDFAIEPGNTDVVYGRGLEIHATLSGAPVERVELVVGEGANAETLPMFPESGGKWRASLARITDPAPYFVRADRARSHKYNIGVLTTPTLESVRFRITPPAYTRDAVYDGPMPKTGILALAGAKVHVTAKSNRPLKAGMVELESGKNTTSVALRPVTDKNDEVAGEFVVATGGKFSVQVTDVAGQTSQDPFIGSITLLEDQRPFVRILEPKAQSLATPTAAVPVTLAAEDDYGVLRLEFFRSLNDSRPLPTEVTVAAPPPRRLHEQVYLPLGQYGLQPGDVIKLFARVEDNDPAGGKGSESSVVTIRIIAQEEFEKMLRMRQGLEVLLSKYQQAQRRMEGLAEKMVQIKKKLAELPPDSPAAEEQRRQLQRLTKEMKQEAAAIEESAKHLLPYDIDDKLKSKLDELSKALQAAASDLEELEARPSLSNKEAMEALEKLAKALGDKRQQFDKEASEPLAHLAAAFPLMEDQARFVALTAQQVDLAERLATLKGKDNADDPALKARIRDLEQEQRRNREELSDLLDDIEQHATALPEEPAFEKLRSTALKFAVDVRASGASEMMSEAEVALSEFGGTRGHQKATEAAETLKKFLSQCEGVGEAGEGCLAFSPSLSSCLGDTVAQLLAEAGLGNGNGPGQGSGNGYSARSNSLKNVGLYGGLPGMDALSSNGNGQSRQSANSKNRFNSGEDHDDPALVEATNVSGATGGGQGSTPARYRQRVGKYLQRIAEEANTD
jgi:hypothetical protein